MVTQTVADPIQAANDALLAAMQAKVDLESQAQAAMDAKNMAEVLRIGGEFQKAEVAIAKAKRQVANASTELTKAERDTLKDGLTKLVNDHRQEINQGIRTGTLNVIATRTGEHGFDDFRIAINVEVSSPLHELVAKVLTEAGADGVESAKRIRIMGAEVTVDPVITAKVSGGNGDGGSSGKGYVKDGVSMQLAAAFDQVATAEEKATLESLAQGEQASNKTYAHKQKVVLAAGFEQN